MFRHGNHAMQQNSHRRSNAKADRRFGLRVEGQLMQLAIATREDDGVFRVEFDDITSSDGNDWLASGSDGQFADAFNTLVERHQMRRAQIAVSLDGEFCVTRVAMGTPEQIDKELEVLPGRAARYLSLGPGEKISGTTRMRIESGTEYFVAAVINRAIIERIYEAMLSHDMNVRWAEPSLVSMARLIDASGIAQQEPLLLADGTGTKWDIGIVHCGRLLLDYRPASASTVSEIRATTESHIERLRRFCARYLNISGETLSRVLVMGSEKQTTEAKIAFGSIAGINADTVAVPSMPSVFRLDERSSHCQQLPAIAAILPLLIGTIASTVPDMLSTIRRDNSRGLLQRMLSDGWPALAATACLLCGWMIFSAKKAMVTTSSENLVAIEMRKEEQRQTMSKLADSRQLISHLRRMDEAVGMANWASVIDHVSGCLSDDTRINQIQFDESSGFRLDGSVQNDLGIYDLVGHLRRNAEVTQVALQSTSATESGVGTNFRLLLQIDSNRIAKRKKQITDKIDTRSVSFTSTERK